MINKQGYADIIQTLQKQICLAEYFVSQNINTAHWNGHKNGCNFALDEFRAEAKGPSSPTPEGPIH